MMGGKNGYLGGMSERFILIYGFFGWLKINYLYFNVI